MAGIAFAIVLFFYLVPSGTPKATYWWVTGGGTALSVVVGWLLALRGGKATTNAVVDEQVAALPAPVA
jgi:hypothetical protein